MTDLFEEWITTSLDGATFEEWLDHKTGSDRAQPVLKLVPKPVFGEAPDERQWIHNVVTDEWIAPDGSVHSGASLTREMIYDIAVRQRSQRIFTAPPVLFGF